MKHTTRSWKHVKKQRKQYGKRNEERYETPFIELDEIYLKEDDGDDGREM